MTYRLPDFYIAGARKCGTTSLRTILNNHDDLFIPPFEPMFFCLDEFPLNKRYFPAFQDQHIYHDLDADFETYYRWFRQSYDEAPASAIWGEDAPSYLLSRVAPQRLAHYVPEGKLIILLRNPVARAYSHYWLLFRLGEATHSFERALHNIPELTEESFYKRNIERLLEHVPRKNIKFVVFEEFVSKPQKIIDEVCQFLGRKASIDLSKISTRHNKGHTPPALLIPMRRLAARLRSHVPCLRGIFWGDKALPKMQFNRRDIYLEKLTKKELMFHLTAGTMERMINLFPQQKYPPMEADTALFLEELFTRENQGLEELTGCNIKKWWS